MGWNFHVVKTGDALDIGNGKESPDTVVKVYNVGKADKSEVMTDVSCSKAIAVAFGCYGWSGESVKILQERLKDAGFKVVDENVRSFWNPGPEDLDKIPAMVVTLLSD